MLEGNWQKVTKREANTRVKVTKMSNPNGPRLGNNHHSHRIMDQQ